LGGSSKKTATSEPASTMHRNIDSHNYTDRANDAQSLSKVKGLTYRELRSVGKVNLKRPPSPQIRVAHRYVCQNCMTVVMSHLPSQAALYNFPVT
jgi:hypothetical protein